MYKNDDKIRGTVFGGALGDALGAPVEGIRDMAQLKNEYGPNGIQELMPYQSFWDDGEQSGIGIITDDTTMAACSLAGIIETKRQNPQDFDKALLHRTWQYYLHWGAQQKHGEAIAQWVDPSVEVPEYLTPFLFRCGAGKGTIAALSNGHRGDADRPQEYDVVIDGKRVTSPNAGCGAMMRIAPIAFLGDENDVMSMSLRNAAMTHGDRNAMTATALIGCLTHQALRHDALHTAFDAVKDDMIFMPEAISQSMQSAQEAFAANRADMVTMNHLAYQHGTNPFLALPVLTQSLYVLKQAASSEPSPRAFKDMMRLAVNHCGDSDSVGAIVGNVIGASWGYDALPKDWIAQLQQERELHAIADAYRDMALKDGPR